METNEVPEEIRTKALAAVQAVYRLTESAPFDAALRFELREKSTRVLSGITGIALRSGRRRQEHAENLAADVATIRALLALAEELRFVTTDNAARVLGAYERIGGWVEGALRAIAGERTPEGEIPLHASGGGDAPGDAVGVGGLPPRRIPRELERLNGRQRRIVEYLSENRRAQIGDICQLFGEACSEKTLQRDLWQLVSFGIIRKKGDNRWTTYVSLGH